MRILIDGDGCPVIDITIRLAKEYQLEALILCDTSHMIQKTGAKTLTFSQGRDNVDFALVNMAQAGDIIVTQDYGLAAMGLAKNARPINQDGLIFDAQNIDSLLLSRHTAKKIRQGGGKLKGPAKRDSSQDISFAKNLRSLLEQGISF